MKQNIYDDPTFFSGYRALRQEPVTFNSAIEQPALYSLLPDLRGKRVLDLGCGFGTFCREANRRAAARVLGVDLSARMLDEARTLSATCPQIEYQRCAIEDLEHAADSFDLVVSSLALHYIRDFAAVAAKVQRWLAPGGLLIFSVEHPISTAPFARGWCRDAAGKKTHWQLDNYREEGERREKWIVENVIKYHRTMETYINSLIDAGLTIRRVLEPEAIKEVTQSNPDFLTERRRPPFLLIAAQK